MPMTGVLGGGVIFVVAALLWAAVLVPSWARRREFRAAERNAVRLQRTLRVLAETSEIPEEVRIEATAREALAQEKLLRTAQRRQEAERKAELAEARAEQVRAEMRAQQMKRRQASAARSARLRRPVVRRLRAVAALVALLAFAGLLVGTGFAVAGQGPAVLGIAALCLVASTGGLVLMAPGRVKHTEIIAENVDDRATTSVVERDDVDESEERVDAGAAAAAHAALQAAAAARIERARAMARARSERPVASARSNQPQSILLQQSTGDGAAAGSARRADNQAEAKAPVVAETPSPAPVVSENASAKHPGATAAARRSQELARAERLRRMGVVGDTSDGKLDLDAALRQRRNAG